MSHQIRNFRKLVNRSIHQAEQEREGFYLWNHCVEKECPPHWRICWWWWSEKNGWKFAWKGQMKSEGVSKFFIKHDTLDGLWVPSGSSAFQSPCSLFSYDIHLSSTTYDNYNYFGDTETVLTVNLPYRQISKSRPLLHETALLGLWLQRSKTLNFSGHWWRIYMSKKNYIWWEVFATCQVLIGKGFTWIEQLINNI